MNCHRDISWLRGCLKTQRLTLDKDIETFLARQKD